MMRIKLIFLLLILTLALPCAVSADENDDIQGIEAENDILQQQLEEEEAKVAELRDSISSLEFEISSIDNEMEIIYGYISRYEDQKALKQQNVRSLEADVDKMAVVIEEKEAKLQEQYELMKKRIQYMYENSGNSFIESLFSSDSFSEAARKIQYILELINYDRRKMQETQAMLDEINAQKAEQSLKIDETNAEIENISLLADAQEGQRQLYETLSTLKKSELADVREDLEEALRVQDVLSEEIERNKDQINSLIEAFNERVRQEEEEMQRQAEEARRIEEENEARRKAYEEELRRYEEEARRIEEENEARRRAYEEELRRAEEERQNQEDPEIEIPEEPEYAEIPEAPEEPEYTEVPDYSYLGWIWPVSGYYSISSPFGYRDDPDLPEVARNHEGIDIPCPEETPILAVQDGVVVVSNWSPYIGYYMVVYHGNNLFSEMHHMCMLSPSEVGEYVSQGQVIGYSGATGIYCYGAHLHFGVCVGADSWALTNYDDPLYYLP